MGRNVVRKELGVSTKRDDLYSWAVRQAELRRAGRLSEIDLVAITEEIDDVGEEEDHRLESAFRVVMLQLLKWDHQRDSRTRSYEDARLEASSETGLPLKTFPTKPPFDYSEVMERRIVLPGDEE
jgi:Domain of unknown function DUF29